MTAPAAFPRDAACQPGHTATGSQLPNPPLTSLPPGAPSHWPHGCRPPGASQPGPITAATPATSLPASAFSPVETVPSQPNQPPARLSAVLFPYPAPPATLISFCDLPSNRTPSARSLAPSPAPVPPITSSLRCESNVHFPTRPRLRTRCAPPAGDAGAWLRSLPRPAAAQMSARTRRARAAV